MKVLFRCDGNATVGLGHLSRSLALADAVEDEGGESIFVGAYDYAARVLLRSDGPHVVPLAAQPASLQDAEETAQLVAQSAVDAVVIDGYRFGADFLERLAQERTGRPLTVVDDFGLLARYPRAARILNFTFGAEGVGYEGRDLRIRRGPGYTLLRRATRNLRRQSRPDMSATALLVAIGGVDRAGFTESVLRAAARTGLQHVEVVMSEGAPGRDTVERLVASVGGRLFGRQPNLAERFAAARACVTGGGLTKYEACYLGLPCAVMPQSPGEAEDTVKAVALGVVLAVDPLSPTSLPTTLVALGEEGLRAGLRAACYRIFPMDPTRAALQLVVGEDTAP
jgi:spore coat polysaccharide biosynthesis predicted glycosyltransferase SpsG